MGYAGIIEHPTGGSRYENANLAAKPPGLASRTRAASAHQA